MTTRPREVIIDGEKYVRWDFARVQTALPFEIYPRDLPETMTYMNTVKAVAKLNSDLGLTGDRRWRIGTREENILMYEHKEEIGGFCTGPYAGGSGYPGWYWSSTEYHGHPSSVWAVRFLDGNEDWNHKDGLRLSCRPVRFSIQSPPIDQCSIIE